MVVTFWSCLLHVAIENGLEFAIENGRKSEFSYDKNDDFPYVNVSQMNAVTIGRYELS